MLSLDRASERDRVGLDDVQQRVLGSGIVSGVGLEWVIAGWASCDSCHLISSVLLDEEKPISIRHFWP